MRICSLLPSGTEIVAALGLVDALVGVSYECDFPPAVKEKPIVVNTRLPEAADPGEIDALVREYLSRGESLYKIEGDVLRKGEPDLVVTQELCNVCAATPGDLASALGGLAVQPRVLSLHPHRIEEVWNDILAVGEATERLSSSTGCAPGSKPLKHSLPKRRRARASFASSGPTRPWWRATGCPRWWRLPAVSMFSGLRRSRPFASTGIVSSMPSPRSSW
jgi:hypothetical protein